MTTFKIGIDVGGTFTDFFFTSSEQRVDSFKVLSTPEDPSTAVLEGLRQIAEAEGISLTQLARSIGTIVHGTTVTTNAVLTRRGARTALLTTEGLRDALEMRRGIREEQYNNRFRNVTPLVPRYLRLPVRGRLDYAGREVTPLDLESVERAAEVAARQGVEAVAICFMNAFANADHEERAAQVVQRVLPKAFLSVSSRVLPTVRFYERVSTTALDAFVGPVLRDYLGSLSAKLAAIEFGGTLLIMQSSGGVALPDLTLGKPAATLLSGPAAGPRAALAATEPHGDRSCLVVDMGGTSFDASLVQAGAVALHASGAIDRLRVALPMLDIATIGAGGGSIGWLDAGGLLRMGPQSAGADPGPACYGRGGKLPTCTDANLVLGYLDGDYFAGGRLRLSLERAAAAIEQHIARPLSALGAQTLDTERAAVGMYRVINNNMAHGVREITIKRGLDPREFPLVVAGGAGALHACMIAAELDIRRIVVPQTASVLCAAGMLMSDLQHDFVRSWVTALDATDLSELERLVAELAAEGEAMLAREGVGPERRSHRVGFDLRYRRQYHEVTVTIPRERTMDLAHITAAFHREHDRLYGYELSKEQTPIELINVRVQSVGLCDRPALRPIPQGDTDAGAAHKGSRRAFVPERDRFEQVPVYDGHRLAAGNRIAGPALLERSDTTILLCADFEAVIDAFGSCSIERVTTPGGAA